MCIACLVPCIACIGAIACKCAFCLQSNKCYCRFPQAEIARIESVGGWVDDGRVCGVLAVSRCGASILTVPGSRAISAADPAGMLLLDAAGITFVAGLIHIWGPVAPTPPACVCELCLASAVDAAALMPADCLLLPLLCQGVW